MSDITGKNDSRLDLSQAVLLVIDMQQAFTDPNYPLCVVGAAQTIPTVHNLISLCRNTEVPVFWIRRIYEKDGSDMEAFRRKDLGAKGCTEIMSLGHPGALPSSGLKEEQGEPIVIKKRFSSFFQTGLIRCLRTEKSEH